MPTRVLCTNFAKTEAIESFARDRIESAIDPFDGQAPIEGQVCLEMKNSPQHPGPDSFSCRISLISRAFHKKTIVLKKEGGNLYQTIQLAAEALHALLSRLHEKQVLRRRRAWGLRSPRLRPLLA